MELKLGLFASNIGFRCLILEIGHEHVVQAYLYQECFHSSAIFDIRSHTSSLIQMSSLKVIGVDDCELGTTVQG